MKFQKLYQQLLRRSFFKGQYRIFNYLFNKGSLNSSSQIVVQPLNGNFRIKCDTNTWIGAQIVYLGEYEDYIKDTFKAHIKTGDRVLDIGANVGFHTLYFAELVGASGRVIAFEPIPTTFAALVDNIQLNHFRNITAKNVALGNENKTLKINVDATSRNPGATNLFVAGNTEIDCRRGDAVLGDLKVHFIKIDVEGYELFALEGLARLIEQHRPKIVFEYDKNYQLKNNKNATAIFDFLKQFDYSFYEIKRGATLKITEPSALNSYDVLALPST